MSVATIPPPVRALVRKELREFRQHRMILVTAVALPVAFLLLPVVNLLAYNPEDAIGGVDFAVGQAMFCFFLTPVIIPAMMAAYSIIGERDQGTLEPLLTLPMSDVQFLGGKVLAIVLPTIGVAWGIFVAYMAFVAAVVEDPIRPAALDCDLALRPRAHGSPAGALLHAYRRHFFGPGEGCAGRRTPERPDPAPRHAPDPADRHADGRTLATQLGGVRAGRRRGRCTALARRPGRV